MLVALMKLEYQKKVCFTGGKNVGHFFTNRYLTLFQIKKGDNKKSHGMPNNEAIKSERFKSLSFIIIEKKIP